MKTRPYSSTLFITLFALAIPVSGTAAQKHHHYRLIDVGTFGGPTSYINQATDTNNRAVNLHGTPVGFAATATSKLPTSNPIICGGDDTFGFNVTHALQSRNGTVTDLGALPPVEANCSNAYQVNAGGEIVGFSENGQFDPITLTNQSRAVHWKNGKIEDLGSLGGNQNEALAINNRGQIVGFSLNTVPDSFSIIDVLLNLIVTATFPQGGTQTRAVLWDHGRMQDLGTLGGDDAQAFYINDHGEIAGVSYTDAAPNPVTGLPTQDAFLWEKGKMLDLGNLGGGYAMFTGQGGGLNNRGQVIGVSSVAADPNACVFQEFATDGDCHPFLWNGSKLIDLNTSTAGGTPLSADGINDLGEVVGIGDFSSVGGSSSDAYLWQKGVATDLGALPGDCFSRAQAVNARSQVVGNSFSCDGNDDRAFLWEHGSIIDLNTAIAPGAPLRLVFANQINDRGEIGGVGVLPGVDPNNVEGRGSDPGSGVRAFLLIPCDEYHPDIEGCDYSAVEESEVAASHTTSQRRMTPEEISRIHALLMNRHRGYVPGKLGSVR